ncbi:hypothetical protein N665_0048s0036 [Sinapis alba]|nr:hypothetical protein N665_0048s0036 [Sinapis alba]
MTQQMAPNTSHIHVTSDRQVDNLLKITKMHEVRLCVSSLMRTVNDGNKEAEETNDVSDEGEEEDEDEGEEEEDERDNDDDDDNLAEDENDKGEEDADISDVAEADDDGEDYSEYGRVKDEDEKEEDDMCFQDFKATHGSEEGSSNATNIYTNQSFVIRDSLISELPLTSVKCRFSFKI